VERFRCPSCHAKLQFQRLFDDRYLALCEHCRLFHLTAPDTSAEAAYLAFLEAFDDGRVVPGVDLDRQLDEAMITRSAAAIAALLKQTASPPQPLVSALRSRLDYVVSYRALPRSEPPEGSSPSDLPLRAALRSALDAAGIHRLYAFQEQAIGAILEGEDVVIVAPTGSGKTEAFTLPLLEKVAPPAGEVGLGRDGRVIALVVYPTKALARDQLPKIRRLADSVNVRVGIFDGDTPIAERGRILARPPELLLTNFDILHLHLMHRTPFSRLLPGVRHLVVDEVHVYTGTFGANVHYIVRRLERLCGRVQIVAASATIGNAEAFTAAVFGRPLTVVHAPRGKHGRTHFAMIFPTLRSHRALVLDLLQSLGRAGYRTLAFSRSHLGAELTAFYARRAGLRIEVHRAGLVPSRRMRVEQEFKRGDLQALASTPTLELGLDIGLVDAVISDLVNVTRLTQRIGRAGRRGQESIVYLAMRDSDPISQHYRLHPEDYFRDVEPGFVDPLNPLIARHQLLAAALDRPLKWEEFPEVQSVVEQLVQQRLLLAQRGHLVPDYVAARHVLRTYDIRGAGESVSINLGGRKVGERSMPLAMEELYPGGVYLLGGSRYRSISFSFRGGRGTASVEPLPAAYPFFTQALLEEWPTIERVYETKRVHGLEVGYCALSIEKRVVGYLNRDLHRETQAAARVMLTEPLAYAFRTKGLAFTAPAPAILLKATAPERREDLAASSFHAAEHVLIEGTNMVTGGAAEDMGGLSMGSSGLIFVYDGSVGGNGATRLLFDRLESALRRGQTVLSECGCTSESGCPRCTYSYRCGNDNDFLHKSGAREVYGHIFAGAPTALPKDVQRLRAVA
jgi:DEAD/DEAH box helicase domain-containing protein